MLKQFLKTLSEAEAQYKKAKKEGKKGDAIYWRRKLNDGYILLFLFPLFGYVIGYGGTVLVIKIISLLQ